MDLISIIIPVFKVEKYLDECLSSVVSQTYKNLEIILVDDGSPDNCPSMCDSWSSKDNRIIVIHKSNGGLSDARNAGLKIARGKYVTFVDSDDWLAPEYIEYLYRAAKKNNADIVACNFYVAEEKSEILFLPYPDERICTAEEAMRDLIQGIGFRAVAWNKLYRSELLQDESFEVGKLHEDEFFTYRMIDHAENLVYLGVPLYYYRQRQGSIMSTASIRHLDSLEAYLGRLRVLRKRYPNLYKKDRVTFCKTCIRFYRQSLTSENGLAMRKRIIQLRRQAEITIWEYLSGEMKDKVYLIMSAPRMIGIYSRLMEIRRSRLS